jgi:hypothetical protein
MNFSPYFPYLFFDFGTVLYKISAHDIVEDSEFRKTGQVKLYFSDECKSDYIYACIVKQCDILEVKNAMV